MSLRRNMAWVGASQAMFFIVQFAGSVIVARLLTPYETGVYAVALAIVGVLSTIQAFGLTGFVVREAELDDELMASVLAANTMLCLLLASVTAGLSFVGGAFLREDGVRKVMLYLAVLPLLDAVQFSPSARLERNANFKAIALISSGRTLLTQGVTVGGALLHYSYLSMAYGQIAASVFSAIAYNCVGWRYASFKLSTRHLRKVGRFGLEMLTISGVNTIALRLSEAALGRIVGLSALGLYSRASNLNNLAWENIHLLIGRVVFVDLAEQKRAGLSLRGAYLRIVEMMTALLWPAFIGLAVVAGPFILSVYGARWVAAAHPLTMLALAACLLVSISMTWEVFVVCGETSKQARIEVVRASTSLALFCTFSLFGLVAAAAARILDAAFSIFLYRPHLNRMTQTRLADFVPIYARSALLTFLAVGPSAAYMAWNAFSEAVPIGLLALTILLGLALWALALFRLGHPLASEAQSLITKFKERRRGFMFVA